MTIALPAESAPSNPQDRPDMADPDPVRRGACAFSSSCRCRGCSTTASSTAPAHSRSTISARWSTDQAFVDPLITTVILATSSSVICCAVAAPDGLAGRAHRPAAASHGARAGDRVVRDAAVPRRHRLGAAGGAQFRPHQQDLARAHRNAAGRAPVQHLLAPRPDLRHLLLHLPLRVRADRECARPHPGRSRGRLLGARRPHLDHRAPRDHPARVAGPACRRARRLPAGDDVVRLAGDPRDPGRLPHHDHQDLEPVQLSAQARARGRRLACRCWC